MNDLTFRQLERHEFFDFDHFLKSGIPEINGLTVNSSFDLKQFEPIGQGNNIEKTFYSNGNSIKIIQSSEAQRIKKRFVFSGEGIELKLDVDSGKEFGEGLIHFVANPRNGILQERLSICVKENIKDFLRGIDPTIVLEEKHLETEALEPFKKAFYKAEKSPLEILESAPKLSTELRFKHVHLSYRESLIVQYSNNECKKIILKDLPAFADLKPYDSFDLHFSSTLILYGQRKITLKEALEKGKGLAKFDYENFTSNISFGERSSGQVHESLQLGIAPFRENDIIALGAFTGYGSHESGGYFFESPDQVPKNSKHLSHIKACRGEWLLAILEMKASEDAKIKLIMKYLYDDRRMVTPWNSELPF